MAIIDSGARRQFDSGAVRDIQEGKGRCDLLPLIEVSVLLENTTLRCIGSFMETGDTDHLHAALREFRDYSRCHFDCLETMILEYAKHMEEGAQKYQERNWEKGIPLHCFIDSGVRHLLKFYRGDSDERHDRAFVWNVLGAIWTVRNHPELCDLPVFMEEKEIGEQNG